MSTVLNYTVTFLEEYGIWLIFALLGIFIISIWILVAIEARDEKKEFKERTVNKKVTIKMLGIVATPFFIWLFVAIVNPPYFGYGYSVNNLEIVAHKKNALWVIDDYIQSTGGMGSSIVYRIQGIDLNSGTKSFKKLFSNSHQIEGVRNDLLWIKKEVAEDEFELEASSIFTGKVAKTVTKESLTHSFPELQNGIYNFSYNSKTELLDIVSKDGLKMTIDPETFVKIDSAIEKEVQSSINKFSVDDSRRNTIISIVKDGERGTLVNKYGKAVSGEVFFLNGQFIAVDSIAQHAFTFSYETLERKNFVIRSVSFSGKVLWEVNQQTLKVGDFFVPEPTFETSFIFEDALIVCLDGFVFSLNKKTGELNWLIRI